MLRRDECVCRLCLLVFVSIILSGCGTKTLSTSATAGGAVAASPDPAPPILEMIKPEVTAESSSSGINLLLIRPGQFLMGTSCEDPRAQFQERPLHIAEIKQPYYLGTYEVTQAQYKFVMGINPSWFSAEGTGQNEVKDLDTSMFPIESLSWYDALRYLNTLSELELLSPYYSLTELEFRKGVLYSAVVKIEGGSGYRLPTEAEWEYACRAGSSDSWSFGDKPDAIDDYAVNDYLKSGQRTHPVGQKKPNALGFFDIHGNVAEMCADAFSEYSYRDPKPCDESVAAMHRVVRGGSWFNGPMLARCASRNGELAGNARNYLGLRVARTADLVLAASPAP